LQYIADKFYYCVDGMFNAITCPAGLVFNPKTGICTWPDEAQKKGCSSEGMRARKILEKILRISFVLQRFSTSRARKSTNRLLSLIQDMLILKIGERLALRAS
jgi:hypothetical protein